MADKLQELRKEAERLKKTAARKDHAYEAFVQAVHRANSIIDRLSKGDQTDAEKKLVTEFKKARTQLAKKRDEAKKVRDKKEGHLRKLRIRIKAIRQKRKGGKGFHGIMQDSINLSEFSNPNAVAGYTSGYWPTYPELKKRFPDLPKMSYAIDSSHDADALDVEPGDATPADAPGWVKRQQGKVGIYGSISSWAAIQHALDSAGIDRKSYYRITAHYNGIEHRCSSACGYGFEGEADVTQFTDHYQGHNLDGNLCAGLPWHK